MFDPIKKLRFDRIEDWFYRWQCWKNIQSMKLAENEPVEYEAASLELKEVETELKRLGCVCIDGVSFQEHYV